MAFLSYILTQCQLTSQTQQIIEVILMVLNSIIAYQFISISKKRISETKDPTLTLSYSKIGAYIYYLLVIQGYIVITYICLFSILILYSQFKYDSLSQLQEKVELDILAVLQAGLQFLNFFNDLIDITQAYEWAVCIYMMKGRYGHMSYIL